MCLTIALESSMRAADNSVFAGNSTNQELTSQSDTIIIRPSCASTNAGLLDASFAGTINYSNISQVLQVYADLIRKTVLCPANLSTSAINLSIERQMTSKQIATLDVLLVLNGVGLIPLPGERLKAAPLSGGCGMRQAALDGNSIAFVTHVIPVFGASQATLLRSLSLLRVTTRPALFPWTAITCSCCRIALIM